MCLFKVLHQEMQTAKMLVLSKDNYNRNIYIIGPVQSMGLPSEADIFCVCCAKANSACLKQIMSPTKGKGDNVFMVQITLA